MIFTTHFTKMPPLMQRYCACNPAQLLPTLNALNLITMSSTSKPQHRCASSLKRFLNPAITPYLLQNDATSRSAKMKTCFPHLVFQTVKQKIHGFARNQSEDSLKKWGIRQPISTAHDCNMNSMLWSRWVFRVTSLSLLTLWGMQRKLEFA